MTTNYIVPGSKEYNEIFDFLKEKLSLPDGLKECTIRMACNDVITVDCTFRAHPKTTYVDVIDTEKVDA